jgi:hypothetical protein
MVSDESVVFLFCETVVIFVIQAAMGEQKGSGKTPPVDSIFIDEVRTMVTVKLADSEGGGGIDGLEAIQSPAVGHVEKFR